MTKYNPQKIEKKWQKNWLSKKIYKTKEDKKSPKYYVLDMFPYPSGAGLHVGHPKGYIATDIVARMKTMQGASVLHPMGWDAFGLPTENYAIKNKIHPKAATDKNIKTFKKQLELLGFTYDWEREVNTTDPEYYKWTQWAFLQMFKKGLAFESYEPINWCPECQTGLANEDLEDGKCERCGSEIERKPMRQWVLKITAYADRLLKDLDKLTGWPEPIKEMQKNWIGRSEGARVKFDVIPAPDLSSPRTRGSSRGQAPAGIQTTGSPIRSGMTTLEVFTTRPDTLFGATYVVLAPEHSLISNLKSQISNFKEVEEYINKAKKKSDLERTELQKEKTGVELKGVKVINPVNNEELPIFVADYVLGGYGTGAIMAVPAHDERDWEFAKKYNLPIVEVLKGGDVTKAAFIEDGELINSNFLNGHHMVEAKAKMIAWLEEKGLGRKQVQYKLRDWVFSRQRYWGEPIPIVHCAKCGAVPVPEKELPVKLPNVKNYKPSGTGESPLANIDKWVNTQCPKCGDPAKRETNTMPQWAGSSWYYLRYIDPKNKKALVDKSKEKYWSPVDLYVGGAEHATRHLIYARFWHKFLFDIGAVNYDEPFTRLQNVGLILAEDGRKMSKRWGNVINPNNVVKQYGADTMRLYEMFMGPFDQPCAWSTQGLVGVRRFIERVWNLQEKVARRVIPAKAGIQKVGVDMDSRFRGNDKVETLLHQTIKKVGEDIEGLRFNTAVSALMILSNALGEVESIPRDYFEKFILLLSPFAPHLAEELWSSFAKASDDKSKNKKHGQSVVTQPWPQYDPAKIVNKEITIALLVNNKVRDEIVISSDIAEEGIKAKALKSEKVQKWLAGKPPKKVIYVKGRLVNIIV
ncbi:MAG: leucine--tRNA ligase [Patescibacteria group bacterium]